MGAAPEPPFVPDTTGLTRVSPVSPYGSPCDGVTSSGFAYLDAEVEPRLAVNPANPSNLFAAWQQDRWTNHGSHALRGAVSTDGGATWSPRSVPFSRCSGGNSLNGGDYERASDPWVTFAPDGTLYWMSLSFNEMDGQNAMLVARSTDGGGSWGASQSLIADPAAFGNDKNAITADPNDPAYAYAVWDRADDSARIGPTYFARTTDGGASWESARPIYNPGAGRQTLGNQIVVLADGTLVNVFNELDQNVADTAIEVIRSTDHGATWSVPVLVDNQLLVRTADPDPPNASIREGGLLPDIATAPGGIVYVVWEDARFSSGARNAIALSKSTDGGLTWSAPVRVNGVPGVQAWTPSVSVAPDGTLAVGYYDMRDNGHEAELKVGYWVATSKDGASFVDRRAGGPFDQRVAPTVGGQLFVGDYQGLVASGTDLHLLFVQANGSADNRTDVYARTLPVTPPASAAKSALSSFIALPAEPYYVDPDWRARIQSRVAEQRRELPWLPSPITAARDD